MGRGDAHTSISAQGHFETRTPYRAGLRSLSLAPPSADRRSGNPVTQTGENVTAARSRGGLCNLSLKPLLNPWMANAPIHEMGDGLDVHVVSNYPDICVPIMHRGQQAHCGSACPPVLQNAGHHGRVPPTRHLAPPVCMNPVICRWRQRVLERVSFKWSQTSPCRPRESVQAPS